MKTTQRNSTMREAFDSIKLKNISKNARPLVNTILDSLNRKVGLVRENDWNASLSFKTAQHLKAKEDFTFERQPRMAYDFMVTE